MSSTSGMSSGAASGTAPLLQRFLAANNPANMSGWRMAEKVAVIGFIAIAINALRKVKVGQMLKVIPGAASLLDAKIESETTAAAAALWPAELTETQLQRIPDEGVPHDLLLSQLEQFQKYEPKTGHVFGYTYHFDDEKLEKFVEKAYVMYMHENALNPTVFPTLRKFEVEVVQMTLSMLNAPPEARGCMTSGGSESLLLAVKTYRDRARALTPHITAPEVVVCSSVHFAVTKACAYFDVKPVFVPMDTASMKMDVEAARKAINSNTILIIGSAPQYPHGVVDPIEQLAGMARERNIPMHVDACMGGFMLPWVEALGYPVPLWDFRVPGVTSISADVHKYGYTAKGASTLSWVSHKGYREYQFFAIADWPGGMAVSPTMAGTRPGGAIAAAWATLQAVGAKGYKAKAKALMEVSVKLQQGIQSIPELRLMGQPAMSIVSWAAAKGYEKRLNVFALADVMDRDHGFRVEAQQHPSCIHVTLTPPHAHILDAFLSALRASVATVLAHPELSQEGQAATMGLVESIPDTDVVEQFLGSFLDKVLQPTPDDAVQQAAAAAQTKQAGPKTRIY